MHIRRFALPLAVLVAAASLIPVQLRADEMMSAGLRQASELLEKSAQARSAVPRGGATKPPIKVVVYHTNDIHGQLLPQPGNPARGITPTGGAASLATVLWSESLPWLWLDSGDWFQGTPIGNLTKGRAVVALFNQMGLRVTLVGNHEFDYGEQSLREILKGADFKVLGSNHYRWTEETGLDHLDYLHFLAVERIAGIKLGFVGLTTPDTPPLRSVPAYFDDEMKEMASIYLKPLKKLGSNAIIVLSHVGVEKAGDRTFETIPFGELAMARTLPGVDMILGGHLHLQVNERIKGLDGREVLVSQTPGMLRSVNRIELSFDPDTKALLGMDLRAIRLDPAVYPPDEGVLEGLKEIESSVSEVMQRPIGVAAAAMERTDRRDSDLGNLVTDAWREHSKTDFAITGTFGLRENLPAGSLTYEHVYRVFPFDNDLIRFRVRGADLRQALEACVSRETVYCQMSGISLVYDPAGADKSRLRLVMVGGAPLVDDRIYTGAADDYKIKIQKEIPTAEGQEIVGNCRDVFATYFRAHTPVSVPASGRVRRITGN